MANWLGTELAGRGKPGDAFAGLDPPSKRQAMDAALVSSMFVFPGTRIGSGLIAWLGRQGLKRIGPPSIASFFKNPIISPFTGYPFQMAKETGGYLVFGHRDKLRNPISQSPGASSQSYQQSVTPGGTSQKVVKPSVPQTTIKAMGMGRVSKRACPPGYSLVRRKGKFICLRNDLTIIGKRLR